MIGPILTTVGKALFSVAAMKIVDKATEDLPPGVRIVAKTAASAAGALVGGEAMEVMAKGPDVTDVKNLLDIGYNMATDTFYT